MGAVIWPRNSLQYALSNVPPPGFEKSFVLFYFFKVRIFGLHHPTNPASNRKINDKIATLNRDYFEPFLKSILRILCATLRYIFFLPLGFFFSLLSCQQSWLKNCSFVGSSIFPTPARNIPNLPCFLWCPLDPHPPYTKLIALRPTKNQDIRASPAS